MTHEIHGKLVDWHSGSFIAVNTYWDWLQKLENILEYLQVAFWQTSYLLVLISSSISCTSSGSVTVDLGDVSPRRGIALLIAHCELSLLVKS